MSDDDKIIDLSERMNEREHADWERERERLYAAMAASNESIGGLVTAALNALLALMQQSGMTLDEAKAHLASRIKMFR